MERTGGDERDRVCQAFHGEAPQDSRESTRPSDNGVNLRDSDETGIRGFP